MVIQHNISALNSHRNMGLNNSGISKNLEKLSSGYRINRAGDDAAGLAVSEKMRGQIRGLAMAEQNTANGISLIQTAEGGLNETHAILQRMRELSVQSSNGTYQDEDRVQLTKEFEALKSEVDRIAESTHYNGIKLLDGNLGGEKVKGTEAEIFTAMGANGTSVTVTDATGGLVEDQVYEGSISFDIKQAYDADGKAIADTFNINYKLTDASGAVTSGTLKNVDKTTNGEVSGPLSVATGGVLTFEDENGVKFEFDMGDETQGLKEGALKDVKFSYTGKSDNTSDDAAVDFTSASYVEGKGEGLVFQIGANGGADQRVGLTVRSMDSKNIGITDRTDMTELKGESLNDASIATIDDANKAIEIITDATLMVSSQRAELGALQNRLEHTSNNLGVTKENLTAAESTIRDVDMAKEMMEFTKNNILVQASQSMLAQANQLPQGVLQLLR